MSNEVLDKMEQAGIIPVVVIEESEKAVTLGKTILKAGLKIIEITMRTKCAMEVLKILDTEVPELLLGAGTVFSQQVAEEAVKSGARFIVSPHLDEDLVTYCISHDIVCVPGVFTPSEIQKALKIAQQTKRFSSIGDIPLVIKVFPASTGGPGHIKALKAVFPDVRFLPLGGVTINNLPEYFKAGVWAVGGTWMCKKEIINEGNFDKIATYTKEALQVIAEIRKNTR